MEDFSERYSIYKREIEARLRALKPGNEPQALYEPIRYVLDGGGKRIRPVLLLLSCEAAGGSVEDAYDAGVAVEILHNFTLVHDDIMDNAPHRRGRESVHKRWDVNTAVLAGDSLIGIAYETLLRTDRGDRKEIIRAFTEGMIEVCEGQSYDKEFEHRQTVSTDEYLMMIGKKTGRLVTMSAEIGALIGEADAKVLESLSRYASFLGRAFQIQDDLLDIVADEETFGKIIGGDILEGKKTFLLVEALQKATGDDLNLLQRVARKEEIPGDIVERVRQIYERYGIIEMARDRIRTDTGRACSALRNLQPSRAADMLVWFAEMLLRRDS